MFVLALVAALWAGPAGATPYYWDTNDVTAGAGGTPTGTWGTDSFWNTDPTGGANGAFQIPTANTDDLYFVAGPAADSGNAAYAVTVSGGQVGNSLNFQSSGAATISGGTSITLGDGTAGHGGINVPQYAYGTTAQGAVSISTPVILNNSQTWTVGTGSALTVSGAVSGSGMTLTKAGTGTLVLSGANSYDGGTVIDAGKLQFNSGAVPATGAVTINAAGTLLATGAYASAGAWLASGKIATSSSGVIALTAANTVAVDFSAGGYNNLYLGATGAFSFGAYALTPGANGYLLGGGGGTITLNGANTLGAGANLTIASNLTISAANSAFDGAVALNAGTLTLGNTAALGSPSAITLAGGTTLSSTALGTVISAPVTLGAGTVTVNAPAGIGLTLNGKISGNGNLYLNSTNANNADSEILLGAASDYAGDTTFASVYNARLRVKLGIANALPTGTVLTLNGAGTSGTSRNLHFDLNGFDQTVGGLANVSQAKVQYAIKNSGATPATLTVSNVADCTYSAPLWFGMNTTPNVNLTKAGAGVLTLSGLSGYSGVTTVNGGVLSVSALADGAILTPTLTVTGNNSANITASDTTGLEVGMVVMCQGIAQNKTIASITDATHFVLNSGTGNAPVGGLVSAIGPANNLGGWGSNDAANLVLNGGTLQYTGPAVSTARNFTLGTAAGSAIDASGSGALTWTGNPTLSGTNTARTFTLTGASTADNTFAGALGDNGTGATSLVKSGPGKWVLDGAKTYTGDTIIEAGTLSISSAYLADAADVYLTTDAVFSLDFTGTDTIGELFFNDVTQAAGIWGSPTSTAANKSIFFAGAGLLSVTGGVVLGDTNEDKVVDAADYIAVKTNFGLTGIEATLAKGNVTGAIGEAGTVDWDDLQILMANFGTGGAPAAMNTPEPATLGLLAFGSLALLRRRRAA